MNEINGLLLVKTIIVYIYPFLSLIGVVSNILSFIIFSRKKFQNTIFSTYFRCLVTFDTLTISLLINKFFELNFNIYFRDFSNELCKFRYYFIYSVFPISGWTLVLISIDRFMNISFPNKFLFIKRVKFQFSMCFFVLGFNLAYYFPNLFYYIKVNVVLNNSTNQTIMTYKCTNPGIPIEWMDMIESTLLPFICMLLFTSLTIILLFRSRKKSTLNNSNKLIRRKDLRFALTSITLNFVFFLLNLPYGILSLTNMYNQDLSKNKDLYQLISSLFYLLTFSNSATVFFINLAVNSMFRNEFMRLIQKKSISNPSETIISNIKSHK